MYIYIYIYVHTILKPRLIKLKFSDCTVAITLQVKSITFLSTEDHGTPMKT